MKKILLLILIVVVLTLLAIKIDKRQSTSNLYPQVNRINKTTFPITNQWYSSGFFQEWPSTLFVFPLAVNIKPAGISVSYPKILAQPKTVYSQFEEDFLISGQTQFDKQQISAVGDMHVTFDLSSTSQKVQTTIAHGIPTVWVKYLDGDKEITIHIKGNAEELLNRSIRINNDTKSYLVTSDLNTQLSVVDDKLKVILGNQGYVAVTLEPKDTELEPLQIASPLITSSFNYSDNSALLSYGFEDSSSSVVAMLPHQWAKQKNMKSIGSYDTLRGEMKAFIGNKIILSYPEKKLLLISDMVSTLSVPELNELSERVKTDIETIEKETPPAGVYEAGKWLFKLSQLVEIANAINHDEKNLVNQKLIKSLREYMSSDAKYFIETQSPKGIIAKVPQYGNEEFNDHHFHYGYFLAAAAVGIELDPTLKEEINLSLEMLLKDIANINYNIDYAPLRGFDPYESHSWASGYSKFADGNNQESTSEAVNRWYGIYKIGTALKDRKLTELGEIGMRMESDSAKTYWLLQNPGIYKPQEGYTGEIVSLLWGGKVDFATWFSPKPEHVFGIQFLPISPAMKYVCNLPEWSSYTSYKPQDLQNGWADIYYMVAACNNENVPEVIKYYEPGNSSSFYYLWTKYFSK